MKTKPMANAIFGSGSVCNVSARIFSPACMLPVALAANASEQKSRLSASRIKFSYEVTDLTIRNNGHTIQVDHENGSHIAVNGVASTFSSSIFIRQASTS